MLWSPHKEILGPPLPVYTDFSFRNSYNSKQAAYQADWERLWVGFFKGRYINIRNECNIIYVYVLGRTGTISLNYTSGEERIDF